MQEANSIKLEPIKILASNSNSAFKPIHQWKDMIAELEAHGQQIINLLKHIPLRHSQGKQLGNPFAMLVKDMIFSIYLDASNPDVVRAKELFLQFNEFSFQLYRVICLMCHLNLFEMSEKYEEQLSTGMIFQKSLSQLFKRCFFQKGQDNCYLSFEQLDWILTNLTNGYYKQKFRDQLYSMCGGTFMTIQQKNFNQTLKIIVMNIGKYFTEKSTFLTKHYKTTKKSRQVAEIVNNSIKFICNYKNQLYLTQEINKISSNIFDQQILNRLQFISKMSALDKKNATYLLWIYIDLLRVQCIISMDSSTTHQLKYSSVENQPNFYVQEMQKLLNKCPYNGDDCCKCKKCQCIRRNRKSAKVSQEKKRSAVEQLNPLKQRLKQLQIKNSQLEQQNQILKGIVHQMRDHPAIRQLLSSTLEPMSKIINDDN